MNDNRYKLYSQTQELTPNVEKTTIVMATVSVLDLIALAQPIMTGILH